MDSLDRPVTVLVIGCGSIGRRHARLWVERLGPGAVKVADQDAARARALADELGIQATAGPEAGPIESNRLALVCTPHLTHVPVALEAARAGYHLFIEKPICLDPDEAAQLQAEVRRRDLRCLVACNMRFHPAIVWLRDLAISGGLGEIYSARALFGQYLPDWRPQADYREFYSARADQGGGVLMDCIHELDYITWLMGPVRELTAHAARVSDLEIDVEDLAEVTLVFDRGRTAQIHLDGLDRYKRRSCQLVGSKATAVWESSDRFPEQARFGLFDPDMGRWNRWTETIDNDDMFRRQIDHVLACLSGDEEPLLDLAGGLYDVSLVVAARRASAERRWVQLDRDGRVE